jgi:hypothetical protein
LLVIFAYAQILFRFYFYKNNLSIINCFLIYWLLNIYNKQVLNLNEKIIEQIFFNTNLFNGLMNIHPILLYFSYALIVVFIFYGNHKALGPMKMAVLFLFVTLALGS